jgi:K+-transporting ATPase ATPase A chain
MKLVMIAMLAHPFSILGFTTSSALFTGLLVFVVIVVGGLTFLPSLALGPIAEQLMMGAHQTF